MEITDIIGEGKQFEPPFALDDNTLFGELFLVDKNDRGIYIASDLEGDWERCLIEHICGLLNREHCKEGGEE